MDDGSSIGHATGGRRGRRHPALKHEGSPAAGERQWVVPANAYREADPFSCSADWQLAFHEALRPRRALRVLTSGDSLVALAMQRHGPGRLLSPIECGWKFASPLVGPQAESLLAEGIASGAFDEARGKLIRTVELSGLRPGSARYERLQRHFADDWELRVHDRQTLCNASLQGGFDGYLSRRSKAFRRSLGKQTRRASRAGVYFERCLPTNQREALMVFDRMVQVESASWKADLGTGLSGGAMEAFYACLILRLAAHGGARVIFARHADEDIGFIFGGRAGGVYRGQQFGFVEDWRKFSIGNLLQLEQIQWLCEERARRYDMGPMMDYKSHWTEKLVPIESCILVRRARGS